MPYVEYKSVSVKEAWEEKWRGISVREKASAVDLYPEIKEVFHKHLTGGGPILEAGCGLGEWVNYLAKKEFPVIGLDFLEPVIRKVKDYDRSLMLLVANARALPFRDGSSGCALSIGVVEHIPYGFTSALFYAFPFLRRRGGRWDYRLNLIGRVVCGLARRFRLWSFGQMQMAVARKLAPY